MVEYYTIMMLFQNQSNYDQSIYQHIRIWENQCWKETEKWLKLVSQTQTKWRGIIRVRFNDSWFVFHNSIQGFDEPYYSRKHKIHELHTTDWIKHKISPLYRHISTKVFLLTISSTINFFIKHHFFLHRERLKITKTRKLFIESYIYCLIYSGTKRAYYKIML